MEYQDFEKTKEVKRIDKGIFVVHGVVAGATPHRRFLQAIKVFCKANKANQVVLPIREHAQAFESQKTHYAEEYENLNKNDYFVKSFTFNKNLKAVDLQLNPQNLNPLASCEPFTQADNHRHSVIIAHPKQDIKTVPHSNTKAPHLAFTTGVSTLPCYRENTIGVKAAQNHKIGCVIVEIFSEREFRITQVEAAKDGSFIYDRVKYSQAGITKGVETSALILGDLHAGQESQFAFRAALSDIKKYNPNTLVLHDAFDFASLNHHEWHNIPAQRRKISLLEEKSNILKTLAKIDNVFQDEIVIVPSNHNDFLERRLTELRFDKDPKNSLELCELYVDWVKTGESPAKLLLDLPENYIFPNRDEDVLIQGWHMVHGDMGIAGAKGSQATFKKTYGKCVTGHTHTPAKNGDVITVGTTTPLKQAYTKGLVSWMHANCVIYKNGQPQVVFHIEGN